MIEKIHVFALAAVCLVFAAGCGSKSAKPGAAKSEGGKSYAAEIKKVSEQIEAKTKEAEKIKARIDELDADRKKRDPEISAAVKKELEQEPVPTKFIAHSCSYKDSRMVINLYRTNPERFLDFCVAIRNFDRSRQGCTLDEYIDNAKKAYLRYNSPKSWEDKKNAMRGEMKAYLDAYLEGQQYEITYKDYFEKKKAERIKELYKEGFELANEYKKLMKEIGRLQGEKLLLENKKDWAKHRKDIVAKAPRMIGNCKRVKIERKPFHYNYTESNADEWWNGVATMSNGKKVEIEVMYGKDKKSGQVTMTVSSR